MKHFEQYLSERQTHHEFRLKVATELTDAHMDALELHLRKYDGFDISTPIKTIIQRNPRDFKSIDATEIYIVDFKTNVPVQPNMLLAELTQKTGIHERFMILRNKNEPLHIEDEQDATEDIAEKPKKYHTLLTDPNYSEFKNPKASDYYGEDFKKKFQRIHKSSILDWLQKESKKIQT